MFTMTLNEEPFRQMQNGTKTVEVRLYDEKRRKLQVGDGIRFRHKDHSEEIIDTEVVALRVFSSFEELFSAGLLTQTGSDGYTVKEAAEKMYDYYTPSAEQKYGVLAIAVRILR